MKGPRYGRFLKGSTEASREAYLKKHHGVIEKVIQILPRERVAVLAVICKGGAKFGESKAVKLCEVLRDCTFNGQDDPALKLWKYLLRTKHDAVEMYKNTVTAVRAYCEGRPLVKIREAEEDIED